MSPLSPRPTAYLVGAAIQKFSAGDAAAVAVACGGERVDGVDLPAGGSQACDQQAARGLDGHRYGVFRGVAVAGEQFQKGVESGTVVADAHLGQLSAVLVHQGDVMVVLGPVDSAEDLAQPRSPVRALPERASQLHAEHAAL
jgi:hypothetical protein